MAWAIWHVILFALMGRSGGGIIWQSLVIVLLRVIIVWSVVNTTDSVFIAALLHAMSNLVWGALPVFRLPPPTGPYSIGSVVCHWTDKIVPRFSAAISPPGARG